MSDLNHLSVLDRGVEEWNRWRENVTVKIDLSGAVLVGRQLGGADLSNVYLHGAKLSRTDLSGANLRGADFTSADLTKTKLNDSELGGAKLVSAELEGADLSGANLGGADLSYAKLNRAILTRTKLRKTNLTSAKLNRAMLTHAVLEHAMCQDADLSRSCLQQADLRKANLLRADLRKADLDGATLIATQLGKARLAGVKIGRSTTLQSLRFHETHDEMDDGADRLVVKGCWAISWISWARLRFLSEVPLFTASYAALGLLFVFVHSVDLANTLGLESVKLGLQEFANRLAAVPPRVDTIRSRHPATSDFLDSQLRALVETIQGFEHAVRGISLHVPERLSLPDEIQLAFLSAVTLVVGTTLYRLFCPASVQRFSEVEWVAQLRRPRLLHIADSLSCGRGWYRRILAVLQILTFGLIAFGGSLAVYLLLVRSWRLWELLQAYA